MTSEVAEFSRSFIIRKFGKAPQVKLAESAELNLVEVVAHCQPERDFRNHSDEDVAAVRQALTAMNKGETGRPMVEFDETFRSRNGIK